MSRARLNDAQRLQGLIDVDLVGLKVDILPEQGSGLIGAEPGV